MDGIAVEHGMHTSPSFASLESCPMKIFRLFRCLSPDHAANGISVSIAFFAIVFLEIKINSPGSFSKLTSNNDVGKLFSVEIMSSGQILLSANPHGE